MLTITHANIYNPSHKKTADVITCRLTSKLLLWQSLIYVHKWGTKRKETAANWAFSSSEILLHTPKFRRGKKQGTANKGQTEVQWWENPLTQIPSGRTIILLGNIWFFLCAFFMFSMCPMRVEQISCGKTDLLPGRAAATLVKRNLLLPQVDKPPSAPFQGVEKELLARQGTESYGRLHFKAWHGNRSSSGSKHRRKKRPSSGLCSCSSSQQEREAEKHARVIREKEGSLILQNNELLSHWPPWTCFSMEFPPYL